MNDSCSSSLLMNLLFVDELFLIDPTGKNRRKRENSGTPRTKPGTACTMSEKHIIRLSMLGVFVKIIFFFSFYF